MGMIMASDDYFDELTEPDHTGTKRATDAQHVMVITSPAVNSAHLEARAAAWEKFAALKIPMPFRGAGGELENAADFAPFFDGREPTAEEAGILYSTAQGAIMQDSAQAIADGGGSDRIVQSSTPVHRRIAGEQVP
jgi:hypothetical protein